MLSAKRKRNSNCRCTQLSNPNGPRRQHPVTYHCSQHDHQTHPVCAEIATIVTELGLIKRQQNKLEKNYIELTPGMPVWVQHRQNTFWEPATVVSQCNSNSYWIMQENGTDQPKVYRRTRAMLKIRCTNIRETRHSYSQLTEWEKAEFHTPAIPNATRNCVEHNSAENISQDLVHPTKSDIEASASFDFKSEEREEIADVPAFTPAHTPAPALERFEEQSHTPGSRKSMRKNFGKPASSFSDFYM